jgi:hypothetical protein
MKPRVFVSHSSVDTWVARQLAIHIRTNGADTFLDEADIQAGDDFEDEILKAEATCTELVVLLTPWSLKRNYVWMEIAFFRRGGKRIVGVLHGTTVKSIATDEKIAVLLKKLDLIDLNNVDTYFAQLKGRVAQAGSQHV